MPPATLQTRKPQSVLQTPPQQPRLQPSGGSAQNAVDTKPPSGAGLLPRPHHRPKPEPAVVHPAPVRPVPAQPPPSYTSDYVLYPLQPPASTADDATPVPQPSVMRQIWPEYDTPGGWSVQPLQNSPAPGPSSMPATTSTQEPSDATENAVGLPSDHISRQVQHLVSTMRPVSQRSAAFAAILSALQRVTNKVMNPSQPHQQPASISLPAGIHQAAAIREIQPVQTEAVPSAASTRSATPAWDSSALPVVNELSLEEQLSVAGLLETLLSGQHLPPAHPSRHPSIPAAENQAADMPNSTAGQLGQYSTVSADGLHSSHSRSSSSALKQMRQVAETSVSDASVADLFGPQPTLTQLMTQARAAAAKLNTSHVEQPADQDITGPASSSTPASWQPSVQGMAAEDASPGAMELNRILMTALHQCRQLLSVSAQLRSCSPSASRVAPAPITASLARTAPAPPLSSADISTDTDSCGNDVDDNLDVHLSSTSKQAHTQTVAQPEPEPAAQAATTAWTTACQVVRDFSSFMMPHTAAYCLLVLSKAHQEAVVSHHTNSHPDCTAALPQRSVLAQCTSRLLRLVLSDLASAPDSTAVVALEALSCLPGHLGPTSQAEAVAVGQQSGQQHTSQSDSVRSGTRRRMWQRGGRARHELDAWQAVHSAALNGDDVNVRALAVGAAGRQLVAHVASVADRLGTKTLSSALHACARLRMGARALPVGFVSTVCAALLPSVQASCSGQPGDHGLTTRELATVGWSLAVMGQTPKLAWKQVYAAALSAHMSQFSPAQLLMVASTLKRWTVHPTTALPRLVRPHHRKRSSQPDTSAAAWDGTPAAHTPGSRPCNAADTVWPPRDLVHTLGAALVALLPAQQPGQLSALICWLVQAGWQPTVRQLGFIQAAVIDQLQSPAASQWTAQHASVLLGAWAQLVAKQPQPQQRSVLPSPALVAALLRHMMVCRQPLQATSNISSATERIRHYQYAVALCRTLGALVQLLRPLTVRPTAAVQPARTAVGTGAQPMGCDVEHLETAHHSPVQEPAQTTAMHPVAQGSAQAHQGPTAVIGTVQVMIAAPGPPRPTASPHTPSPPRELSPQGSHPVHTGPWLAPRTRLHRLVCALVGGAHPQCIQTLRDPRHVMQLLESASLLVGPAAVETLPTGGLEACEDVLVHGAVHLKPNSWQRLQSTYRRLGTSFGKQLDQAWLSSL